MTIWVVRAGRYGEREEQALERGHVYIGWGDISDLSKLGSKEKIKSALEVSEPDSKQGRISNFSSQIWNFYNTIKKGDIVALPLKNRPAIAFGEVIGDYKYIKDNQDDAKHSRKVKWIGEPILRTRFDQDLKYSFGGAMTVFSVHRNDAEKRIRKIISQPLNLDNCLPDTQSSNNDDIKPNLMDVASQQISDFIGRKFKGRKLEQLVEAVLKAQDYETNLCPEGADGGVDILAGRGAMGFDNPKICVQVKSSDNPIGTEVLSQLKGAMGDHHADYGLLVAWGGFKSTVVREGRRAFFNIRLWNDQKLVEEVQEVYEKLPKEIQAELPLKQSWLLVEEE